MHNVFYQTPTPKHSKVQRGEGPGDSSWVFWWFHPLFCGDFGHKISKICSSFGSADVPQRFISSHPGPSNVCLLQFGTFKQPNHEVGSVHVHHVVLRVRVLSTSLSFDTTLKLPCNLASLLGCNPTSVLMEVWQGQLNVFSGPGRFISEVPGHFTEKNLPGDVTRRLHLLLCSVSMF